MEWNSGALGAEIVCEVDGTMGFKRLRARLTA
jgi:hypothetical protein